MSQPSVSLLGWVAFVLLRLLRSGIPHESFGQTALRVGLERLCRYVLRPLFAQARLRLRAAGPVALELERACHDGTSELVFRAQEFLERLAVMPPRPKTNLLVCHDVLAPRARWRERVVVYGRVAPEATPRLRRWSQVRTAHA